MVWHHWTIELTVGVGLYWNRDSFGHAPRKRTTVGRKLLQLENARELGDKGDGYISVFTLGSEAGLQVQEGLETDAEFID